MPFFRRFPDVAKNQPAAGWSAIRQLCATTWSIRT